MKKKELIEKLQNNNISSDFYSLKGGLPNEAFCLDQAGDLWSVYYSERGQKTDLKFFNDEEGACEYFYSYISTSDTVKRWS